MWKNNKFEQLGSEGQEEEHTVSLGIYWWLMRDGFDILYLIGKYYSRGIANLYMKSVEEKQSRLFIKKEQLLREEKPMNKSEEYHNPWVM